MLSSFVKHCSLQALPAERIRYAHTLSSIADHLPQSVAKFHVCLDCLVSLQSKCSDFCLFPFGVQEIVADRASGCHVWDTSGRKLMDLTSGIGVTSTGHSHPTVIDAIHKQANKIIFAQQNILPATEASISLIDHLKEIMPKDLTRFFFCNSGSEAVDNALKVARSYTGKQNIIAMQVRRCCTVLKFAAQHSLVDFLHHRIIRSSKIREFITIA